MGTPTLIVAEIKAKTVEFDEFFWISRFAFSPQAIFVAITVDRRAAFDMVMSSCLASSACEREEISNENKMARNLYD